MGFSEPAITCSKLTIIETLKQGVKYVQSEQERLQNDAGVFIANFEYVLHLVLPFLLLTLSR